MTYEGAYETLISLGLKRGFRPDVPIEAEGMFRELLKKFDGEKREFVRWIEERIDELYKSVDKRPIWIQDPEWPIRNGSPMMFLGQLDVPASAIPLAQSNRAYYLFLDPRSGETSVVAQWD